MARPDLSVFLIVNNGIRQEFGLLAKAAKGVRNDAHRALIESQISICVEVLRLHHREEDNWLFPTLVLRIPESEPGITGLLADHQALEGLINEVADTSRTLEDRSAALDELDQLLNEHIEREIRDVVPLVLQCINDVEWDVSSHRALNSLPRQQLPLAFGWLASANTEDEMKRAMASMPVLERALFKLHWGPAYKRRSRELYG